MQTIRVQADLAIHAPDGTLLALVEVRNLPDLTIETASAIRGNIIAHQHGGITTPYFMVVSQDRGFLWKSDTMVSDDGMNLPTAEFPMLDVVESYLPSFGGGVRLRESQLELAVHQWLYDMVSDRADRPQQPDEVLGNIGFLDRVRNGRVTAEFD